MNTFAISVAALIPAVLLCWYIYAKDRVEKEPVGLLSILFLAGAAIYTPAVLGENFLVGLWDGAFASQMEYSLTGVAKYNSAGAEIGHSLTRGFLAVAVLEEVAKWLILFFITKKNKNFNSLFDGIVYSVFISLGFAAVENVRYAIIDGWDTFILRAVTNVPAQMTFGVVMGVFYTIWHTYYLAKVKEKELSASGALTIEKPFRSAPLLVMSIVVPVILHGIYSSIRYFSSDIMTIIFYIFVFILYAICFFIVHKMSKADSKDEQTVMKLIHKKYPETKVADTVSDNV